MKEHLEYFIRVNLKNPDDYEIKAILNIFHLKKYKKGDVFKRHNTLCKEIGFLIEGSAKHSIIKNNGNEVTGRISQRYDFVTDLISKRTKGKTPIFIELLESTTMLVASMKDVDKLLEVNLTFNRLIREYMADNMVEIGKLHLVFLTGTAKERYKFILENNPTLLESIPLRLIASMIGITPTQLSRIRKKKN